MKKIPRSNELMWLLGTIFVALGVCICSKSDLGVSMIAAPTFIVHDAIKDLWSGFSVGTVEYLMQGLMLIALCIGVQRFNWRYLLAFLVAVIYGYVLDLQKFEKILKEDIDKGYISVNEKELCGIDNTTFEI